MDLQWTKWSRRLILGTGCVFFVAAWVACLIGYLYGVDTAQWVVLVTIAAIATESLVWCAAAALGVTVIQARRNIWQWVVKWVRRPGVGTEVDKGR